MCIFPTQRRLYGLLVLLLCQHFVVFAQSGIQLSGNFCASNPFYTMVRQNGAIVLTANSSTALGDCVRNYAWTHDGQPIGTNSAALNISSFSMAEVGEYSVQISYAGTSTCPSVEHYRVFLLLAPDPLLSFRSPVSALCLPAPAGQTLHTPTTMYTTAQGCGGCTYAWSVSDGTNTFAPSQTDDTLSLSAGDFAANWGAMPSAGSTLNLSLAATDAYGCVWHAVSQSIRVVGSPIQNFSPPSIVQIPPSTAVDLSAASLWASGYAPAPASAQYTLTSGVGAMQGSQYYPTQTGIGSVQLQSNEAGCLYSQTANIEVVPAVGLAFANLSASALAAQSSINANQEACVGDELELSYAGLSAAPQWLRLSARGNSYAIIPLLLCDGNAAPCVLGGSTASLALANDSLHNRSAQLAAAYGYCDTLARRVRIRLPQQAATGTVCLYSSDPTAVGAAPLACLSQPNNLTVQNPEIGFALVKQPMCYSDEALLLGFPSGGVFSAAQAGLNLDTAANGGRLRPVPPFVGSLDLLRIDSLQRTFLVGRAIDFSPATNDGGQMVAIQYDYRPTYSTGDVCPLVSSAYDTVPIFDNRGISFGFPIVEWSPTAPPLHLQSQVSNISPQINGGAAGTAAERWINAPADFSFLGTFVDSDTAGRDSFLVAPAGINRHTVTLRMSNNGCPIESQGVINLLPRPEFVGLYGALCRSVGVVTFRRDRNLSRRTVVDTVVQCTPRSTITVSEAADQIKNTFLSNRFLECRPTLWRERQENFLDSLWVLDSAGTTLLVHWHSSSGQSSPAGVATVVNVDNPVSELFSINFQDAVFNGKNVVQVIAFFHTETRQRDVLRSSGTSPNYALDSLGSLQTLAPDVRTIAQNVSLFSQSSVSIQNLPAYVCHDAAAAQVVSTPAFEPGFSLFTVREILPNNSAQSDTLVENLLDFGALFASSGIDRSYELTYKYVKYFGCDSIARDTLRIIAPQPVFFTGSTIGASNVICQNAPEELLNASPTPTSGLGGVFSGSGVGRSNAGQWIIGAQGDTVRNVFAPQWAGVGVHTVRYTFTDLYGCRSTSSRQITVRPKPQAVLQTANGSTTFCNNDTAVSLVGSPNPAVLGGAGNYFGATVVGNNVFRPNLAYLLDSAAASGGVRLFYAYRDTSGCSDTASLEVFVQPRPILSLTGIGNRYCGNAAIVTNVSAVDLTGIAYSSAQMRARGLVASPQNFTSPALRLASYSPAQAYAVGAGSSDTLWYVHSNIYGCRDSIRHIITIDSVPRPTIQNVSDFYCINQAPFLLTAAPSGGQFVGNGISNQSGNFIFSAQNAANSSGVNQPIVVSYLFSDARGCVGTTRDTTQIRPLPSAQITMPTGYCENAARDTVEAQVSGVAVRYSFAGQSVSDTLLGVVSPAQGVAARGYGLDTLRLVMRDSFGCESSVQRSFFLYPRPSVAIVGLPTSVCSNGNLLQLSGFPAGASGAMWSNMPAGFGLISASQATVQPNLLQANSSYSVWYSFTDLNNCRDTAQASTTVQAAPSPSISGLAAAYCENPQNIALTGAPAGAGNFFAGAGIAYDSSAQQWTFNPFRAGSGVHAISYTANAHYGSLICSQTATQSVAVRPLPVVAITAPLNNSAYCDSDSPIRLRGTVLNAPSFADSVFSGAGVRDSVTYNLVSIPPFGNVLVPDTIYFFSPAQAGAGTHRINFTARNHFGCIDSAAHQFTVYAAPATTFSVDSAFCESAPAVVLTGQPTTGVFSLRGQVLAGGLYRPNPLYPTQLLNSTRTDTILYSVSTGGVCQTAHSRIVRVHPVPRPRFYSVDMQGDSSRRSCLGSDTLQLVAQPAGGVFSGSGLLFGGTQFLPHIAGVGRHRVHYLYVDAQTGCSGSFADTLEVFSQPRVELQAVSGCNDSALLLSANNNALNLQGFFLGSLFDSITAVRWHFGDGNSLQAVASAGNRVDSLQYLYPNAGVYNLVLEVENRHYCRHSDTLRVVVSPHFTPLPTADYWEDFEASAGGWFDESAYGNNSSELWRWGTTQGQHIRTQNTWRGNVWSTSANALHYPPNAAGWVYSPCFDLSQLQRPMISLDYFSHTDEGNDGTVIEYYEPQTQRWLPLGRVARGVDWYDNAVIAGRPGAQTLAPVGWSGENVQWRNARYALDSLRHLQPLRLRVAFGAVGVHGRALEGFAFDHVRIGERRRQVLLEHFAHAQYPNMNAINQHVYRLALQAPLPGDIVPLQYHIHYGVGDEHNQFEPSAPAARALLYGVSVPARAVIAGQIDNGDLPSEQLQPANFERTMLADPVFALRIDSFAVVGSAAQVHASLSALANLPSDEYVLHTAIVEDSVVYSDGSAAVYALVRQLLPNASGRALLRSWQAGDALQFAETWTFEPDRHRTHQLQAVVFLQNQRTAEVYQVASTRNLTLFFPSANAEIVPLPAAELFPNPSAQQSLLRFAQPLTAAAEWRIVDLQGRCLQTGTLLTGESELQLQAQSLPAGLYFVQVYNAHSLLQKTWIVHK